MIFINNQGKYIEINKNDFNNDIEYIKEILKVKKLKINIKNSKIENHILDVAKNNVEIMLK